MTNENGKWPLPEGWVWTTLGEATNPARERVLPKDYPHLPYIGMDDISSQSMQLLGTKPSSEMSSSAEHFRAGDVLYGSLRPYLNKVYCADFEGLCSAEFIVFRKIREVHSKYLQYFLNQWTFVEFINRQNTGDRPRVKFGQMADYPFPLAPLSEQHRIVAEIEKQLTRLDAAVAALRRAKANLARYKAAVLKAAVEGRLVAQADRPQRSSETSEVLLARILAERRRQWEAAHPGKQYVEPKRPDVAGLGELPEGWVWATVEQLTENFDSRRIPVKKEDRAMTPGSYAYYGASGVIDHVDNYLFDGDYLLVAEDGANLLARTTPIAFQAHGQFWVNNHAHVLQCLPNCLEDYLESYLNSIDLTFFVTGTAQPKLTQANLNKIPVPVPPLAEQYIIASQIARLISISQSCNQVIDANLARADALRQGVLGRAFRGELVSNGETSEVF